jgi:putative transposase
MFNETVYIDRAEAQLPHRAPALCESPMNPDNAPETHIQRQTFTFKFRLRDKHAAELNRQARAVNFVWNYLNETQQKAARAHRKWLSAFDLQKLTNGASKDLDLHAHTIQRVCRAYDDARKTHKKAWLRWRGRKSLGWIPFNTGHVSFDGDVFKFRGATYQTMHLRDELKASAKIGAGSFNQDARGRWYLNLPAEVECATSAPVSYVGIDLGLKTLATLSNDEKVEAPRMYRASEAKIATAQRARKAPKRVRNIHAKIANRRKDFLHKASAKIAKEHGLIVVGDVSPSKLAKTTMAKSVIDAGWSNFKTMLSYKATYRGGSMIEVSERFTTQVCSECGSLPPSRPKGIADLDKRTWRCDDCGADHDRDVNAARNILRVGLGHATSRSLACLNNLGSPGLHAGEQSQTPQSLLTARRAITADIAAWTISVRPGK